jgi:hypothetical protein
MTFQIPDKDKLGQFSIAGLQDLRSQAENEFKTIVASVTAETVTKEQVDRMEELQQFYRADVPNHIAERKDSSTRFTALTEPEPPAEPDPEPPAEPEAQPPAVVASQGSGEEDSGAPRISDLGGSGEVVVRQRTTYSTLVASAGVPNYEAGQPLPTMLDVAKAFESRSYGHNAMAKAGRRTSAPVMYPVAQLVRDYPPEFSVNGDETDYEKLMKVMDESRLPGGSLIRSAQLSYEQSKKEHPERDALVAAQGWCAPSETDYDICLQISTDGMLDAPEVQARRGGIRHNTGLEFDTIFGDCETHTGYFDLTEAQVAAGSPTKTCVEIPCPDFTDDRLGVTGLCLTGNILAIRGYPEFTATFTRGALAALAHLVNKEQIAEVVSGSTAVTLSGAPWATDGSTVSQVLSAVEMAIMDIKYRLRLAQSATLDVVMPFWIGAQMRADWIRRNGGNYAEMLTLSDEAINAAFRARGARVQYVYDWQDAFATCSVSGSPGADTAIQNLPDSLSFLVYPAGTWIRAVNDVITLNSVYDSTLLATNQVTHLFTETGWKMMRMCPISRVYTVDICPSGKTTSQGTLTCP